MRGGETLDELNALAAHLQTYAAEYGLSQQREVHFLAICVDDKDPPALLGQWWPLLRFYKAPGLALQQLQVTCVPSRLLMDASACLRCSWNGTQGNVLLGRHGRSLINGSHALIDHILSVVHS